MRKKYNASHKIVVFKEGDFASLVIPKENRVSTDNLQIIVKILEAPHENRYRVQSMYGIIKGLVSITSLNVVTEQHIADLVQQFKNTPKKEILLSQAVAEASNVTRVALSCNCKKKRIKRCVCVKNGKTCTQYCHKSTFNCGNLSDTIIELTEAHLVPRADYDGPVKAPKRKRTATIASTKKPAAKKATSSRNKPSLATPVTTRARAKATSKIGESSNLIDPSLDSHNQTTMSQFEPFAALAHRHTSAQAKKRDGEELVSALAAKK